MTWEQTTDETITASTTQQWITLICNDSASISQRDLEIMNYRLDNILFIAIGVIVFCAIGILINCLSFCAVKRIKPVMNSYHILLLNLTIADLILYCIICLMALLTVIETAGANRIERFIEIIICNLASSYCIINILFDIPKVALFSSILTIFGLVLNLHIAIVYPLQYSTVVTKRRMYIFNTLSWLISIILGELETIASLIETAISPNTDLCYFVNEKRITMYILPAVVGTVGCVTLFLNIRVLQEVTKSLKNVRRFSTQEAKRTSNKLKLAKTCICLFTTFVVFWCPYVVGSIINNNSLDTLVFLIIAFIILLLNSVINPFVYGLRLSEIRQSHMRIYRKMCPWFCGEKETKNVILRGERDRVSSIRANREHVSSIMDDRDHAQSMRDNRDHVSSVRDDRDHASSMRDDRDHANNVREDKDCVRNIMKRKEHVNQSFQVTQL
ncbi:adenosine receptor A1-like [Lingula anatina]|uniref:Adenosine receptor A1-like n=1 Tax=Lingula anatina TaxID=7574 RepID=A0A1S3HYA7_LINAN|nr:adenosine receptor A1-like [Lingula anatina]|eukprot:XP_013390993.1 adenosine receptor A1-like [Lingula anatina]